MNKGRIELPGGYYFEDDGHCCRLCKPNGEYLFVSGDGIPWDEAKDFWTAKWEKIPAANNEKIPELYEPEA